MKGNVKISTEETVCSMDDDDEITNIGTTGDEIGVSTENTKHDEGMYLCSLH